MGVRYIWDPGQQCARMDGAQLHDGITGAHMVICNDYEFELIRQKTGMSEADVLAQVGSARRHAGRARQHRADSRRPGRRAGGAARPHRGSRPASATRSAAV